MKSLLIILDGFGEGNPVDPGNAQEIADMKFYKSLRQNYPSTLLNAIGNSVGLPEGVMGNSEVGHFTMGAGRIVFQTLEMINKSIESGDFFKKEILLKTIEQAKKNNKKLHLVGMISDEGVHAHINHLFALMKLCKDNEFTNVYIHAITDGRDVEERSATRYIQQVLDKIKELGLGKIATINGRYYAMDRDQNFDRTGDAFALMTEGKGFEEVDPIEAIKNSYKRGDDTDYYIHPIILDKNGLVGRNDQIIFFNFRTDRAKQITESFTEKLINGETYLKPEQFVCFGPYSKICPVIFPMQKVKNNLGEYLSNLGLKQLRAAETEKYAHVTFFFNSQIKEPYPNEDHILVDSPKCSNYAEKPEMSAYELTDKLIDILLHPLNERGAGGDFPFIALNYANPDLVGHSGDLKATIQACKVIDECLSKLIPEALKAGYDILLTADHGNCEEMLYPDGSPKPSHSMNKIPCILISERLKNVKLKEDKGLRDVAPTVLDILNVEKPEEMEGETLITK